MDRQELITALQKKFPKGTFRTTEEFDGSEGGVWTSGEDELTQDGMPLFDYYSQDGGSVSYTEGVRNSFHNWLEENGWYCEWYDAGTIMIWEL